MKKISKKVIQKKKRPTVSVSKAQAIRSLAEKLGRLISLSGFRSSFSLEVLAKQKGLTKYIPKKASNKKEAFFEFLKGLHRERPRTIKILVRELLPKAIEKRHSKGDPVLEAEALELVLALEDLGIDLRSEILEMKLPKDRPKIVPPPLEIQKMLDIYILHPALLPDCKKMFIEGHVNESVRKALEKYEKKIQDISSVMKIGQDLMGVAFDEQKPLIKFNNISSPQEKNRQMGFKLTSMGIMQWWRNNLSHGDQEQLSPQDGIARLILVSHLFYEIDSRVE